MSLDCRGLELALEAYVEGRLTPDEAAEVRAHARRCEGCRELLELAQAAEAGPVDLAPAVLARTSGPGCGRARELLGQPLDALESALLRSHLAGCAECAWLDRAIATLESELPLLAEIDPGEAFTRAVLARTPPPRRAAVRGAGWLEVWRRLVLRPRFALEAAYVLTAVVLIVFGVPTVPVAGFSQEIRQATELDLPGRVEGSIRTTGARLRSEAGEAWREAGAPAADRARRSAAEVAAHSREALDGLVRELGTLWARVASGRTNDDARDAGGGDARDGDGR